MQLRRLAAERTVADNQQRLQTIVQQRWLTAELAEVDDCAFARQSLQMLNLTVAGLT